MGRPARANRHSIAETTLTLRLSHNDRRLLDRLVKLRSEELIKDGMEPTVASFIRGLIRREAESRGLDEEVSAVEDLRAGRR